jgi:hypothetical protein
MSINRHCNTPKIVSSGLQCSMISAVLPERLTLLLLPHTSIEPQHTRREQKHAMFMCEMSRQTSKMNWLLLDQSPK